MSARKVLLLSSSKLHGFEYLQHAKEDLLKFFASNNVSKILFVPYALTDHDAYTKKVADALGPWGFSVEGIHTHTDPVKAVNTAQSIFIGGGNTFRLLNSLYEKKLIEPIRSRVLEGGVPYVGSSAGTNVATRSINTTNDMPVVYPPTFEALNLVPFNINPHYLDPEPEGTHKGETREERIQDFHEEHEHVVVGLREGTALLVEGERITLIGRFSARIFQRGTAPVEHSPGSDLSFLLN